jgi:uncharacterized protein involved in outer membrane biogenesis
MTPPRRSAITRLLLAAVVLVIVAVLVAGGVLWWVLTSDYVRASLEAQASRALNEPVRIESARASLLPRPAVRLRGVHVGAEGAVASLDEVRVSTGLRPLVGRRVEDAEITITGGHATVEALLGLVRLDGATAAGDTEAPAAPGLEVRSIRAIVLDGVDLRAHDLVLRTHMRAALDGQQLRLERFEAAGRGQAFTLTGTIAGGPAPIARLELEATELDMDVLAALAGAIGDAPPAPAATTTPHVPVHLTLEVRAARGTLGGLAFSGLETRVEAERAQVRLEPLGATLLGGRYAGRMRVVLQPDGPALHVAGTLSDADATALLGYLGRPGATLTGRVTANVQIDQAPGSAPPLERMRGTVGLAARDGTIEGISAVRRAIIDLAGRAEPVDLQPASDRYDRLTGTFGVAEGRLETRDLLLETGDLDVRGQGSINLATGDLALDAHVVLSPELSAAAGRDLLRYARDGDRIVLPARIGGTLGDPRVSLDVADATRRALRNRLEEEASSLLERLRRGRTPREDPR